MAQIKPNISEVKRFLSIIAPDDVITFQTFDDNKERNDPRLSKILHGDTVENFAELSRLNQEGAGVCFMVNRGDGKGRSAKNVQAVRAIFVDLDKDVPKKLNKIGEMKAGPPRLICESSPEKYHVWWLIEGELPLDCFGPIQKHFISLFGGDSAPVDLPRVMRLPGFFHNKQEPFLSRIIVNNANAKPLPARMLEEKARTLSESHTKSTTHSHNTLNTEFQVKDSTPELPPCLPAALEYINPQPYEEWLKVGMALHNATDGSEEGLQIFISWSSSANNFDESACREKWTTFGNNEGESVTPGTIYHLAKEAGWPGVEVENLTDVGNCRRLIRNFGQDLRFIPEAGKWVTYTNGRWEWDRDGGLHRYAKKTCDLMWREARLIEDDEKRQRLIKHALLSENSFRLKAMVDLASTEQEAVLHQSALDCNPDLFGIANGILDLKTGERRPGRRQDYLTKTSNVAITSNTNASCTCWLSFLEKVMGGSLELIIYLQRAMGYTLTGHTREQCLFFLWGSGSNGKSTFLNVLEGLMGDYCMAVDPETIMLNSNSGGATPELARLMGARAVITNEIEEGKRLAENRIKQMTGGDIMIARHLYREPFEFKPNFKIWMAGNHKPVIKGTDHAIWRRIHLVPFTVTIPKEEQDPRLDEKLRVELPGILEWAIEGTKTWRDQGLTPPNKVKAAVDEYREEMDTMGHWLDECCKFSSECKTESSTLYQSYKSWCQLNGHYPQSKTRFGTALRERGLTKFKAGTVSWTGIGFKTKPSLPTV